MKNKGLFTLMMAMLITVTAFSQTNVKLKSSKSHIKFYSHTAAEDIEANNYSTVSTLDTKTGEVVFSIPMQGFEFKNSMMQTHYNSENFLDTKTFPKAKLVGKIINPEAIDFYTDGEYNARVEGEMTIKGKTNPVKENGTITVKGSFITIESKFDLTLADYGVAFSQGKPASNIAKVVEVTVLTEYNRK